MHYRIKKEIDIRREIKRAARMAHKITAVYRLEKLIAEQKKWKRKATIAINKLNRATTRINKYAVELATIKDGVQ